MREILEAFDDALDESREEDATEGAWGGVSGSRVFGMMNERGGRGVKSLWNWSESLASSLWSLSGLLGRFEAIKLWSRFDDVEGLDGGDPEVDGVGRRDLDSLFLVYDGLGQGLDLERERWSLLGLGRLRGRSELDGSCSWGGSGAMESSQASIWEFPMVRKVSRQWVHADLNAGRWR